MTYGIYDSKDDCWLGDENGPRLFPDLMLARCAAALYAEQIGSYMNGNIDAREYTVEAIKKKDEVPIIRDALTALRRLEGNLIVLSERDQQSFIEALMNPPEPNEALRRAAERYLDTGEEKLEEIVIDMNDIRGGE